MYPDEHLGFHQRPGKLAAAGPWAVLGRFCAAELPPGSALSLSRDQGPTSVLRTHQNLEG